MTTITQQLADALQGALERLAHIEANAPDDYSRQSVDYMLSHNKGVRGVAYAGVIAARAALAAYNDAARPLEVGDRVRIMHDGYVSRGYAVDDETVVRALNAGGCDTLVTCKPVGDTSGHRNGLAFKACDLVRIP